MTLTPWIASRYLLSKRAGRFAPLLTATAIASVAIGMLALILVMSVMRGFRAELADRLLGLGAHVTLVQGAGAEAMDRAAVERLFDGEAVRDVAPFVQGEVIAQSDAAGELQAQGARVRGVDPAELGNMRKVEFYFPEGETGFASLAPTGGGLAGAVVGSEIVAQLSVHPDFRDRITLIAPLAELSPSGELGPNQRRFTVAGIFRSGIFEYDSKMVFVALEEAEKLLGEQAERGWFVRFADAGAVPAALARVRARLPENWRAEGWHEQNRKIFEALKLERIAMGGVLLMVLAIASFAIVGVVLLVTAAKRKDIAILRSIGMTSRGIGRVFVLHAAFIGAAGSVLGCAAGLAVCLAIERWPIRLPDSYYLDVLPVEVNVPAAVAFAFVGILVAVLAALYPVRQAMKFNPVEVIRYE